MLQKIPPNYSEIFNAEFRVFYEDTDISGRVYHARYLHYAERARSLWLENKNFNQEKWLAEKNYGFVVSKLNIKYLQGATLSDTLIVSCQVVDVLPASINLKQMIYRKKDQELLAEITVSAVWLNLSTSRPARLPSEIKKGIKSE